MYNTLRSLTARFLREESGQDLIEYALVVAIIALAAVASMHTLANDINNAFDTVGNNLNNAI